MKDIELPPLVGVLHALPDHIKTAIEAYGAACARMATKEVKHQAPRLCRGTNCGAVAGEDHSPECILEAAESQGWSNSPEAEAARAAVEADRAQRVPDGWKQEAAEAIDWLLNNIRRDAPQLSGKAMGNAVRVRDALLASTPAPAQQEPSIAAEFDVRKIMVSVSPGEDGMGHEVYATSVADVENLLTSMGQELEEWQLGIRRYSAQHQEQPQQVRKPMTDEEIDRVLSTVIPGGSTARDWFLPHDTERGLKNVRDVVRRMFERHHGIKE